MLPDREVAGVSYAVDCEHHLFRAGAVMPPRSPLPQRHGLDAAWVRTPADGDWSSMGDFLCDRLPAQAPVVEMLDAGAFVDQSGRSWRAHDPYQPNVFVWFHRELAPERSVPFEVKVLYFDERIVVVDKPHFLATTPRGIHIRETALVRLRQSLDLPELTPAHRLDRLTAGVLVFTARRQYRAAYATLFQSRLVQKSYEALAPYNPDLTFPLQVKNRIEKHRGSLQATVVPGEPNSETLIELLAVHGDHARYRLSPSTGKTHQLRVHLAGLGLPIVGDPLYPQVQILQDDDFSQPLRLVARSLKFIDPVDGGLREFTSGVRLTFL